MQDSKYVGQEKCRTESMVGRLDSVQEMVGQDGCKQMDTGQDICWRVDTEQARCRAGENLLLTKVIFLSNYYLSN